MNPVTVGDSVPSDLKVPNISGRNQENCLATGIFKTTNRRSYLHMHLFFTEIVHLQLFL